MNKTKAGRQSRPVECLVGPQCAEHNPVRPANCYVCEQPLYYKRDPRHEPEYTVNLWGQNVSEELYVHEQCWNCAMGEPEYEELSDEACMAFRTRPGSFNDMVRAIHRHGWDGALQFRPNASYPDRARSDQEEK